MAFPTTSLAGRWEALLDGGHSDGDILATIADQSGNSRNLAKTTGGEATYKTALVNGQPGYRFNGSATFLEYDAGSLAADSALTISVVLSSGAAEAGSRAWPFGLGNGTTHILAFTESETAGEWGTFVRSGAGTDKSATTGVDTTAWCVLTLTWDQTVGRLYRNGTLIGTTTSLAGALQVQNIYIGAHYTIGEYFGGDIALAGYWRAALDTTARSQLHSYVQDSYAISVSDYSAGSASLPPQRPSFPRALLVR